MTTLPNQDSPNAARPFLKWAGGKTQLLPQIEARIPWTPEESENATYMEPFLGGGAVLFAVTNQWRFPTIIVNDLNSELANLYCTVKHEPDKLITELDSLYTELGKADSRESKNAVFLERRAEFNERKTLYTFTGEQQFSTSDVRLAALFLFLNKTCFNGLYRVNKQGKFNVPYAYPKSTPTVDRDNIRQASRNLHRVRIFSGDYRQIEHLITDPQRTFLYLDPPYRPIVSTGTPIYSAEQFNDDQQTLLADWCSTLTTMGVKFLLSNSDPTNTNPDDTFLSDLYRERGFVVESVEATRMINSQGKGRGKIRELLVRNYPLP